MDFSKRCDCVESTNNVDEFSLLKELVPNDYSYRVCDFYCDPEVSGGFHTRFRVNCFSKEAVREWLTKFETISFTTFRVLSCRDKHSNDLKAKDTKVFLYKVALKCHRNTKPEYRNYQKPHAKHTNCPATMRITVKTPKMTRKYKSVDIHLNTLPSVIILHHVHNHSINDAETLRYRDPSSEVKQKFLGLFQAGHSPTGAVAIHKSDLVKEFEDDFTDKSADRAICPDIAWVYRFYKYFKNSCGADSGQAALQDLAASVAQFNGECGAVCAVFEQLEENNFVVALMSPLMKRVLKNFFSSGEVIFVDSSGNEDKLRRQVYLLMIDSCCEGLPVGVIISSSDSENMISRGFELYKTLIEPDMFNNRGKRGPLIIFIDDSTTLRGAIAGTFPEACVMLSVFHILQATWKNVWKESTGIEIKDRLTLFYFVKKLLYSKEEKDIGSTKREILSHVAQKYPKYLSYVKRLCERRQEWALCCKKTDIFNDPVMNNKLCQSTIIILRDRVLRQTIAYKVTQLFEFLAKNLNSTYVKKLTESAKGHPRYYPEEEKIALKKQKFLKCNRITRDCFEILSETNEQKCFVNTLTWQCSCTEGISGVLCMHQQCTAMNMDKAEMLLNMPYEQKTRRQLYLVATGNSSVPEDNLTEKKFVIKQEKCSEMGICLEEENCAERGASVDDRTSCDKGADKEAGAGIEENLLETDDTSEEPLMSKETILKNFDAMYTSLKERAAKNRDLMSALHQMSENFQKLETDAQLVSACSSFGNYSVIASSTEESSITLPEQDAIIVQSAVLSQDISPDERNIVLPSGIVPEMEMTPEQVYSIPDTSNTWDTSILPPRKRMRAEPEQLVFYILEGNS